MNVKTDWLSAGVKIYWIWVFFLKESNCDPEGKKDDFKVRNVTFPVILCPVF